MIKPIETVYKGYRFRSRLEARWAVYFDAIGIQWEYEKEGYVLGDGLRYLPDFWLPQVKMWAEVKPVPFDPLDFEKVSRLANGTGYSCILLDGVPAAHSYWVVPHNYDVVLTNAHGYLLNENRFYSCPSGAEWECGDFDDVALAVLKAKQARFEHGEKG